MNKKNCFHLNLKTWYGGGHRKAQCLDCFDSGLEQRLLKEQKDRIHKRGTVSDLLSLGYIPLSFSSHRSRDSSGVHSIGIPICSFYRMSHGGYYLVPPDKVTDITINPITHLRHKGITILRKPWTDLLRCWNG